MTEVEQVNDFQIRERGLTKEWGLKVTEIADVRRAYLRENVHWQWRETAVWYSPSGLEELKKYLVPKSSEEKLREKEEVQQARILRRLPSTYPLSAEVVAVNRIWANPRLLQCIDGEGKLLTLRVKSNRHFRKGMRIHLKTQCVWLSAKPAISGSAGLYEFTDPSPRFPGRW